MEGTATSSSPQARFRRSPRALGVLVGGAGLVALLTAVPPLLDRTYAGLRADAQEAAGHLPARVGPIVDSLAATVLVVLLVAVIGHHVLRRQVGAAVVAASAVATAIATVVLLPVLIPDLDPHAVGGEGWARVLAAAAAATGTVAAVTMVMAADRAVRRGVALAASGFVLAGAWSVESVGGRRWLLALGAAAGGLVLLVVGTPSVQPTAADVEAGLRAAGMPPRRVERLVADARGSVPWTVELEAGAQLFVKTASAEERIADLLFRLWRRIRLKDSGDALPAASLQQAAEHESLAATRAIAVGVRAPRVLGLGRLPQGGVYSLHEVIDGGNLVEVVERDGPDAIGEATLRAVWSMVTTLHRGRIAHRDLRAANVVVARDGDVWLVDFAFADIAADEELRRRDLVELLASTAALVGVGRAVDSAVTTIGEQVWHDVLPLVQPLATSTATRNALGRQGFVELRAALAERIQAPKPELPRLGRLDRRTALSVIAVGVATWTLLPQLTQSDEVWKQLPDANLLLVAAAAGASLLTYAGATLSLRGAVPRPLPWSRTFAAQLASSFANRVTPAKVGGLALNVRWLVKEGVESPVAAAGVSVNALVGFVVHVLSTLFVVLWAGQTGLGDIQPPSARTVGVGILIAAGALALSYLIPPLRRTLRERMWPRTRESGRAVLEVAADRRRLVALFTGSLLVTATYVGALSLSLAAVDATTPIATVALVYLAGSAIASAAPTPGGLGATEATFAAGLTAVGVDDTDAVAAVLLYRLVTFWLPILPGYIAYVLLRRADRL